MSFNSDNIRKLTELRRKLPEQQNPNTQITKATKHKHIVETEVNPEKLFKELIKVSKDGNIPPHLLERLKELELNHQKNSLNLETKSNESLDKTNHELKHELHNKEGDNQAYVDFQRLLLEEDGENIN